MGVHGFTTYVQQNISLGRTVIVPDPSLVAPTALIVDALAFLYRVALRETLRGGDYHALAGTITMYIQYWRSCGLEPEFVFDGKLDEAARAKSSSGQLTVCGLQDLSLPPSSERSCSDLSNLLAAH